MSSKIGLCFKNYYFSCFVLLIVSLMLSTAGPLFAQDEEEFTLDEITVTAEKREAELQKVPMDITVIRQDDMDLVYDLKMLDEEGDIKTPYRSYYEKGAYSRMTDEQRAAWDAVYDPIIEDFKARNLSGEELAEWKYNRYMQDYLACVKSLDDNVGRLLKYLDDNGLAGNTLVVYTSDQGFYMGEHGWFDKRFMYEESFRTPLLMRFPKGYEAKIKVDELVQNIDYAPTFLDLAGVAIPEDIQGESLVSLVDSEQTAEWRDGL